MSGPFDPTLLFRQALVSKIREHTNEPAPRVLEAFIRVPRHLFIPGVDVERAYEDSALPIGFQQTISQPSMIATMLSALDVQPQHRVLEIGAGSGYAAALLGCLAAEVYAVEILPELAAAAQRRLFELGYHNVHVLESNGRAGLAEHGPYGRILVSAGADAVPAALIDQLEPGGRIAIPVGDDKGQKLLVGEKSAEGEMVWQRSISCIFVPLVGDDR
jgi:protein-L-isoaspartate(D-aspartate) O-methyltransferase